MSSTQLVTDENGAQVGRFIYGAWGEELYASESVPGILENRFVGGLGCRRDSATGLVLMRHRWYDPALQRFISRDPIGLKGGSQLYKYAGNNPVNNVDVMGLTPGGPYHDDYGTGTHWNNDPADANLRVKAPDPPARHEPVVQEEEQFVPMHKGNIGPQYFPLKTSPPSNPLVDPKTQAKVEKCMTLAGTHPNDAAWLASKMRGPWNYGDPNLKMVVWGAAAEAAGLTKDQLYNQPGVYFSEGEWALFNKGRQYYNQYGTVETPIVNAAVQGTAVESVFDALSNIFGP